MGLEQTVREALALHQKGNLADAERLYLHVLALAPDSFDARHLLGIIRSQQGRHSEALELFTSALKINPNSAQALANCARVFAALGRIDEALLSYDRSLAARPSAETLTARGNLLRDTGRLEEALVSYKAALAINPDYPEALNNCGGALHAARRPKEALVQYDKALSLRPNYPQALNNRANLLRELKRFDEALESYDRAIALKPDFVEAINNRAIALWEMKRIDDARAAFDQALAIDPQCPAALSNRSKMLWSEFGVYDAALSDLETLVRLDPNFHLARGDLLYLRLHSADWRNLDVDLRAIKEGIDRHMAVIQPFVFQAVAESPADILSCSTIFAEQEYASAPNPISLRREDRGKLRVGYVCGEFRAHATSYLTVGLFESHDRDHFEIIAFDNGRSDNSLTRKRLEKAFEKITDISALSDQDAGELIMREGIDILVNLNGYYGAQRIGVFARKPAPIQVNFLGFPATLGAPYIDYIIADRIVIPEDERKYYAEKVVYLPDCYQVNDSKRAKAANSSSRESHFLPKEAFVFCNFNQSYKVTPRMFAVWLRILSRVDNSVLWLLDNGPRFSHNLRHAAAEYGIVPDRLVFASTIPVDEHVCRLQLADLFVDSLPYNGHTTASDALWAGLPVITCRGNTFAGRVATSLLHAAGLPELSVETLDSYEEMAVNLARDRQLLNLYRDRLAANRLSCPLFDTDRYRRHIEAAYREMWEIYRCGEAPRHFRVNRSSQH